MKTADVIALRLDIAQRLNAGQSPTTIARELSCSRTTVYEVRANIADGTDKRTGNPGRPSIYKEIEDKVRAARELNPVSGPMMLHHLMNRNPDKYGVPTGLVPSPGTIALLIRRWGLAHKPIGPHDQRIFPDQHPIEPGTFTIDTWGPWQVRAERLYLATIQDRYTRLSAAIPAWKMQYPKPGEDNGVGVSSATWAQAINLAHTQLGTDGMKFLYSDNGVGIVPTRSGRLPLAARTVLSINARLIFIPPAQPWRNGRLENWHWRLESEYFREERPETMPAALDGLTNWINYYNNDRPHSSLGYRSPGEFADFKPQLASRYWTEQAAEPQPEPVAGVVEAIRLVYNSGAVDCWGHVLQLTPVLAGQFVRLVFFVTGEKDAPGYVLYSLHKGLYSTVATFKHNLDAAEGSHRLFNSVEMVDFADEPPTNQLLDMEQVENQMSRIMRRKVGPRDRLEGTLPEAGSNRD